MNITFPSEPTVRTAAGICVRRRITGIARDENIIHTINAVGINQGSEVNAADVVVLGMFETLGRKNEGNTARVGGMFVLHRLEPAPHEINN